MPSRTDDFDRADGSALAGSTPSGGGPPWRTPVGTWAIGNPSGADGSASTPSGLADAHAVLDAGACDVTAEATLLGTPGGGLVLRWIDASRWLAVSATPTTVALYRFSGGAYTQIGPTYSGAVAAGDVLGAACSGDQITVTLNGVTVVGPVAEAQGQTTGFFHGIQSDNSSAMSFGDFAVAPLGTGPLAGGGLDPEALSFALARAPERMIDAFAAKFRTHSDDFGSDTSADYEQYVLSGTSAVSIGSGSATFSGAAAGGVALRRTAGSWPVAPYAYAEMRVAAASNATPFAGFARDSGNFCWLYIFNGQAGIDSQVGGTVSQTGQLGSYAPPYTLRLVVCWPELWAWIDTGSGPAVAVRHQLATGIDLRRLDQWQAGWRPLAGFDRSAGGSGTMDWFHAGYVGGIGVRDFKPVTYLDGRPYSPDGRIWTTATMAIGDDFRTNHLGVMSLDADTYEPRIESLQFFDVADSDRTNPAATKDTCTSLYGGQLLRDAADGKWLFVVNGWGLGNVSTGVQIWYAETTADVTEPGSVHELDARQLALPTSTSVYDNAQYFDGTNWHLVCAETDAASGWSGYHARLFSGPDLDSLAAGAADATHEAEGLNWCRIGGSWYATAGGTGGPHLWDASLSYLGSLSGNFALSGTNVSSSNYGSHFGILGVPRNGGEDTQYVALCFDDSTVDSGVATKGQFAPFASLSVHEGAEWDWDGGSGGGGLPIPVAMATYRRRRGA